MPIYEFVCEACGNEFEQIQSFSESRMPTCAKCGSANVGRRMSRPAIHFKGSGWYINDSKKSSDNKGGESRNGDAKQGNGESVKESSKEGSESKSETKTESKAESKSEASAGNASSTSSTESKSAAPAASE